MQASPQAAKRATREAGTSGMAVSTPKGAKSSNLKNVQPELIQASYAQAKTMVSLNKDEKKFFTSTFYQASRDQQLLQEEGRANRANQSGLWTFLTKNKKWKFTCLNDTVTDHHISSNQASYNADDLFRATPEILLSSEDANVSSIV